MRRTEVKKWLDDNGGQKDYQVTMVEVPNPKKAKPSDPDTIRIPKVTWIANNGQRLSVLDKTPAGMTGDDQAKDPGGFAADPNVYDPDYEVVAQGDDPANDPKTPVDNRTPEQKANDAELDRQRRKNSDPNIPDPRWETDAEREKRARETIAEQRQQGIDAQTAAERAASAQLAQDRFQFEKDRDAKDRQRQADADKAAAEERQRRAEKDAQDAEIARRREVRENATPLGPMTEDQETIARYNPETGKIESAENPIYNRVKAEAARKEKELALAVQLRKMNADEAATEYTRWYKENVEVPLLQAAERRAQASEQRSALQAEEQRKQFAASNRNEQARIGQAGANMMLDAEMALNPYRVGPEFGTQMSSAINGLAAGGKLDGPAANAGVNFTAAAFEYKKPDLEKIARKGTAAALKGLTPYNPDDARFQTADYSGLNMPTAGTFETAPTGAPIGPDVNSLYNQLYGKPYQYNAQSTRA